MKALMIILAGAVGLTGCMTMSHERGEDRCDRGSSSAYSGKSEEPQPSSMPVKPGNPHVRDVRDLPKEAEDALDKVGIRDMVFLAVVGRDGEIRLLKPHKVKHKTFQLPQTLTVQAFRQLLLVSHKGSNCWAVPPPEGGGAMMPPPVDTFCPPSSPPSSPPSIWD